MSRAIAAVVAALVLAAVGCSSSGSAGTSAPTTTSATADRSWAQIVDGQPTGFVLALGVDASDPEVQRRLARYALVVVDGTDTSAASVAALQRGGTTVLGYLSVGTVEPGRPWFAEAQERGWLLERWDRWDEWYADVSQAGLRRRLAQQADAIVAKGFQGIFLDNTDMVEDHRGQKAGMALLVAALDRRMGPDRLLFAQNGDPIAAGIIGHLDGWNREDVSFTYDADQDRYVPTTGPERRAALAQLRAVRARGVLTTTTDYLEVAAPAAEAKARLAVRRSCAVDALPYVADIGLTQVPATPLTC